MNFQPRRFDRINTEDLAHGTGVARMPKRPTHVDTASVEDEDEREMWLAIAIVVFIGLCVLAAGAFLGHLLWRVMPPFPF